VVVLYEGRVKKIHKRTAGFHRLHGLLTNQGLILTVVGKDGKHVPYKTASNMRLTYIRPGTSSLSLFFLIELGGFAVAD
jgi:hypothetical protein